MKPAFHISTLIAVTALVAVILLVACSKGPPAATQAAAAPIGQAAAPPANPSVQTMRVGEVGPPEEAPPPGIAVPGSSPAAGPAAMPGAVFVNRTKLDANTVAQLSQLYHTPVQPGRYWYDRISGLWGLEGGPYMGQMAPGLNLGGPIPPNISTISNHTGTFFNGREIHVLERAALMRAYGQVAQGQFWLTADGTLGVVGGPVLGNLRATARKGSGGGAWSAYSPFAGTAGQDSNGCMYFSGGDTSWSNC